MGQIALFFHNLLESPAAAVSVTSENSSFPKSRLYDCAIGKLFKGSSTPSHFYIDISENAVADGGMEAWASANNLTSWAEETWGSGLVEREDTIKRAGSYSAKLSSSSATDYAQIYQAVNLAPGIPHEIKASYQNSVAGQTVNLYLFTRRMEKWLNSSGQWVATPQEHIILPNSLDWTDFSLSFTPHPDYSSYRLYLQLWGLVGGFAVYFDSVSISQKANRLIIPAGHNLGGLSLALKGLQSDGTYASVYPDANPTDRAIDWSFTQVSYPAWQLDIASPASAPELPELFLGTDVELTAIPKYGYGEESIRNVQYLETMSGLYRAVKNGDRRRRRTYTLDKITVAQKAELEAWDQVTDGIKSFFIEDLDGELFFAESRGNLRFRRQSNNYWSTDLDILECLA